ncbi:MAG: DUF4040 domain-containing protein [Spirochaetia bacterium]|jgi:uncharacterized MnhB-related membrane protein|nr:DUF4040 domain-containing protein [Spirochaetia bacterium]
MITLLLSLHLLLAVIILLSRNMLTAVILLAVLSLFSSLLFFILHAPDVALTEAAVGAGVSTFLYIWIIRKTDARLKDTELRL